VSRNNEIKGTVLSVKIGLLVIKQNSGGWPVSKSGEACIFNSYWWDHLHLNDHGPQGCASCTTLSQSRVEVLMVKS
jgi:hypothetical protein